VRGPSSSLEFLVLIDASYPIDRLVATLRCLFLRSKQVGEMRRPHPPTSAGRSCPSRLQPVPPARVPVLGADSSGREMSQRTSEASSMAGWSLSLSRKRSSTLSLARSSSDLRACAPMMS
jgi:hypothetical protein